MYKENLKMLKRAGMLDDVKNYIKDNDLQNQLIGAGIGAAGGGTIGAFTGGGKGALIGALLGGATGGAAGHFLKKKKPEGPTPEELAQLQAAADEEAASRRNGLIYGIGGGTVGVGGLVGALLWLAKARKGKAVPAGQKLLAAPGDAGGRKLLPPAPGLLPGGGNTAIKRQSLLGSAGSRIRALLGGGDDSGSARALLGGGNGGNGRALSMANIRGLLGGGRPSWNEAKSLFE